MSRPWDSATQQSKQLTIVANSAFAQSTTWGSALLTEMVAEFNKLSAKNKLGVTFVEPQLAMDDPSRSRAKVIVDTAVTNYSFVFNKQTFTGKLDPPPSLSGMTEAVGVGGIEQAFIFMPATMETQAGSIEKGTTYTRMVGKGVRMAMALHEMLHACGLGQLDPGHLGRGDDLFYGTPTLDVNDPPNGMPGDRLSLGNRKFVPPFALNAKTVSMIKGLWP